MFHIKYFTTIVNLNIYSILLINIKYNLVMQKLSTKSENILKFFIYKKNMTTIYCSELSRLKFNIHVKYTTPSMLFY
jgi:hypothetical protein